MVIRAAVVSLCLVLTHLYVGRLVGSAATPLRQPLAYVPLRIADWNGEDAPIEQKFLDSLQLDDHLNRTYRRANGLPVTLYVGYYGGMRTGNARGPHPPMLCLPGQGWQPIETGRLAVPGAGPGRLTVSRYVIDNAVSRFLLLFWYQVHDRAVPSELASKLYLFADGLALKGTDGALVRVALPLRDRERRTVEAAEREGLAFIEAAQPLLAHHFPGATP